MASNVRIAMAGGINSCDYKVVQQHYVSMTNIVFCEHVKCINIMAQKSY